MRWSHPLASDSAIWTTRDALGHRGCPQLSPLEGSNLVPYQPVLQMSQGPWTSPVAPDTHIWVSELSPWCHLFVLLLTPCRVSIWNRKITPLVNILREKEPIFTKACCKYRKSESKLNFWTVVSKNKASFSSYWQADQQLMQSSCRSVAFRLEGFWLLLTGLVIVQSTDIFGILRTTADLHVLVSFLGWLCLFTSHSLISLGSVEAFSFLLLRPQQGTSDELCASASCSCWHRSLLCRCLHCTFM